MSVGTEGNDNLTNDPTKNPDTIQGLGGDDIISIPASNGPRFFSATINVDGGTGFDTLIADANGVTFGSMQIFNGAQIINVHVNSGSDYSIKPVNVEEYDLTGNIRGDTTLVLGDEIDILVLGRQATGGVAGGFDIIQTNGGNDHITWLTPGVTVGINGGDGDDIIDFSPTGATSAEHSGSGGEGNDTLIGGDGVDRFFGNNGNDILDGRGGADIMTGGAGNDIYYVDNAGDQIFENAGEGTDEIRTTLASYTLGADVENLTGASATGQILTGNTAGNHISGGSGNDTLNGGDGDDILDGGAGADAMAGGKGNDVYYVDDAGDTVTENPGEGTDEVRTTLASYTLSANVENLTGLVAGQTLTGNTDNNVITAAAGDATLHGGAGDDLLKVTNPGSAQAYGDAGTDTLAIDWSGSVDSVGTLSLSSNATDGGYDVVFADQNGRHVDGFSVEKVTITTGSGNDSFVTPDGDDVVNPGSGTDTVNTQGGNDTITIDAAGAKTVQAGTGTDTLVIDYGSATQSVYANVGPNANGTQGGWDGEYYNNTDNSHVDYTSVERFVITTGSGADTIVTKDGDDIVHAGGGDDVVDVGTGGDIADGGSGIDGISANMLDTTSAVVWNLQTNSFSNTGGPDSFTNFEYVGTLTTAGGNDVITTAAGGHNETINTAAGNDTVTVVDGADRFNAGIGTDTLVVDYHTATQSVYANIGPNANATDGGWDGEFYNNTDNSHVDYTSVERFVITTGSGADTIVTQDGDDVVTLNGGEDFVDVGTGGDTADGGSGMDGISADMRDTIGAVIWNLQTNSFSNTGGPDSLTNFEYIGTLTTAGGNDVITTASGGHNETINTAAGNDTVTVVDGADRYNAGIGTDTLVIDYHTATQSVYANIGPNANATDGGWDGEFYNNTDNSHVDYTSVERFVITTGSGADTILTGDGNDAVTLNGGEDFVDVGTGTDSADGGSGMDGISANLTDATGAVVWNLQTNSFTGGPDSFSNFEYFGTITTGGGNDVITTASGGHNETINTSGGDDSVTVADGADRVNAGAGNDTLVIDYHTATQSVYANIGPNANATDGGWDGEFYNNTDNSHVDYISVERFVITTGSGGDDITAASGDDRISTGQGDDTVHASSGDDWVDGGAGNDLLDGGDDTDTLSYASAGAGVTVDLSNGAQQNTGGAGLDTISNFENLVGSGFNDTLTGTGGANLIDGGAGADSMTGGAGDDVYLVDDNGDTEHELAGGGFDEVRSTAAITVLAAEVEKLTGLLATGQALIGNGSDNVITGGDGNDTIFGGAGADTMTGGKGDDTYDVDSAGDTVVELSGEGTDTVRTALASYVLAANVEKLVGTSSSGQSLTGNGLDNDITGNAGNDTIDGGAGADHMAGGSGDDVYHVDNAGDVVVEQADQVNFVPGFGTPGQPGYVPPSTTTVNYGHNDEVVTGLAVYTLPDNVEILTGTSDAGQQLTGNAGDNSLYGAAGDDVLTGGGSPDGDYLDGGAGNDRLVVSTGTESIVHGGGDTDTLVVQLGSENVDITMVAPSNDPDSGYQGDLAGAGDTVNILYDGIEKFDVTTGSGNDSIVTGGGDDIISTGAGNDTLDGGAGADHMSGGAGNDLYFVDDAGDVVTENGGEGTDEIRTTLATFTLPENVEKLTFVGSGDFHGTGSSNADTITGGGGNDVLDGGGGDDYLDVSGGGTDQALGGNGNDAVYFGAAYSSGDTVDGGAGNDAVGLQGDYTGANAVTIAGGSLTNVELLSLMTQGGSAGYDLTWQDGNLADGQKMTIYAGNLASGEDVTFDGSAETHGYFVVYGGLGTDDLKGGSGSDGFYFGPGKFTQADHVDGGGGSQNQLGLDGSYDFEAGALGTLGGNFTNIQTIVLYAGKPADQANPFPNVYHIVTNDDAVAAGKMLTVYGVPVTTDLVFDGSAETNGTFRVLSGTGNDTLTGGKGDDVLYGNLGADTLAGGAGNDTFLYTAEAQSAGTSVDHITDFDAGDHIDLSQIDADTTQGGDQAFTFIGANAFDHTAGELRAAFDAVNNVWTIEGDTDGDGNADFSLMVTTANNHAIVQGDFVP